MNNMNNMNNNNNPLDAEPESKAISFDHKNFSISDTETMLDGAITKLKDGDTGAHWEGDVIEAARELLAQDRAMFQRKRGELKMAHKDSQITDWTKEVKGCGEQQENESRADEMVSAVTERAILFHDPASEGFVNFEHDGHRETWALNSQGFADWLGMIAYKELGFSPSDTTIKQALTALNGIAKYDGDEQEVYLRCAPFVDGYIIDLSDTEWQSVQITADGWCVVKNPTVRFMRSGTSAPLPTPEQGEGNHNLLWNYVNVPEESRLLVLAFILESWRQDTPFIILQITGEQGSAKSTTHKAIRKLTDPNTVPLRAKPKTVEDLYVSASNNWQSSFENMSNLSNAMQDALCTLATGGGFASRRLYTNSEESVIEVKRPVIINGISHVATRPDLIDRLIAIYLPRIQDADKKQDADMDKAFKEDAPVIFSGLLDLFSAALRELPNINLQSTPRMVDFTYFGEAIATALSNEPGTFLKLYRSNRKESLAHSLDSSPAALAIQDFMINRGKQPWKGTVKALKTELETFKHEGEGWPQSPKGLAEVLRRMMPALREFGLDVQFLPRTRTGVKVHISFFSDLLESKKHIHQVHMFTEADSKGERVNVMNIKNELKKIPEKDICANNAPGDEVIRL